MKLTEENYVKTAENVIKKLIQEIEQKKSRIGLVTTSKIRNLLAMTAEIYNDVINSTDERLSQGVIGRINYLKVRVVYEAGREPSVKNFVVGAELLDCLDDIKGSRIGGENYVCKSYDQWNDRNSYRLTYRRFRCFFCNWCS